MKKNAILVFVVMLVSFVAAHAQTNEPLTFQDFIEGKEAFEDLANDEIEHMGVIATMFESLTNDEPWMTYEEAVEKYGETPREKIIFPEVPEEFGLQYFDRKG